MGPDCSVAVILPQCPRLQADSLMFPGRMVLATNLSMQRLFGAGCISMKTLLALTAKLDKSKRGIFLQSNPFGRDRDICDGMNGAKIACEEGENIIVSTIHQKEPLYVVVNVFEELNKLILLKSEGKEGFPVNETRFSAQLSKFNSLEPSDAMYGAISELLSLENAGIDASQRK